MTLVQKGCWTGPPTGQTLFDDRALPPDYSVVRGCTTDLCNANLMTHDSIPNLSPGEPEGGVGTGWAPGGLGGAPTPAGEGAWPPLGASSRGLRFRLSSL